MGTTLPSLRLLWHISVAGRDEVDGDGRVSVTEGEAAQQVTVAIGQVGPGTALPPPQIGCPWGYQSPWSLRWNARYSPLSTARKPPTPMK